MISVRLKLKSLRFPPYFVRFVRRSPAGDLELMLRTITEAEEAQLIEFESELREGHRFEQLNDLDHAIESYEMLMERYPRFAFLVAPQLESARKARAVGFLALMEN